MSDFKKPRTTEKSQKKEEDTSTIEESASTNNQHLDNSNQETDILDTINVGKTPSCSNYLNKDLIIQILKRTSPTTIFRTTLISRDWFHTVTDHVFKKVYYDYNAQDVEANMKLIWSPVQQTKFVQTDLYLEHPKDIQFDIQRGYTVHFVGSANGLLCVGKQNHQCEKPILEEFLILNPSLKNGPTRTIKGPTTDGGISAFGFTINEEAKRYEIIYLEQDSDNTCCKFYNYECPGDEWKSTGFVNYTIYALSIVGTPLNSNLYWLMSKTFGQHYNDLSFNQLVLVKLNLTTKDCTALSCPNLEIPENYDGEGQMYLFNINNRLNIAHILPLQQLTWYTVRDESWTVITKLRLPIGIAEPLCNMDDALNDVSALPPIANVKRNGDECVVIPGNYGSVVIFNEWDNTTERFLIQNDDLCYHGNYITSSFLPPQIINSGDGKPGKVDNSPGKTTPTDKVFSGDGKPGKVDNSPGKTTPTDKAGETYLMNMFSTYCSDDED